LCGSSGRRTSACHFRWRRFYSSLIESPPPGRALNRFSARAGFWIAAGGVFVLDSINALHEYLPQRVPHIPLGYDLSTLMANAPWSYADWALPTSTLYFSIVGLCSSSRAASPSACGSSTRSFFKSERITFSSFGVFHEGMKNGPALRGTHCVHALDPVGRATSLDARDSRDGCETASGRFNDESYLSYRSAGWGFIGFALAIGAWLVCAGASVRGRGRRGNDDADDLPRHRPRGRGDGIDLRTVQVPLYQPWVYALNELPARWRRGQSSNRISSARWLARCLRATCASRCRLCDHALNVADDNVRDQRSGLSILLAMASAIVVAYIVSGASILYVEYNPPPRSTSCRRFPNEWAMVRGAKEWTINTPSEYRPPGTGPREGQNRVANFTFGAALTALLSALRLWFVSWPLHPLGFCWRTRTDLGLWFSIFVGWLAKVLLTRFGGAELLSRRAAAVHRIDSSAKPEQAAFWLVVNLILASCGLAVSQDRAVSV
jgi:hypothetical protein